MSKQIKSRKEYFRNRYKKIKLELIKLLKSKCNICGNEEIDKLQFDHIKREDKKFNIGKSYFKPFKVLIEEISKCQLLCEKCHLDKTSNESKKLYCVNGHERTSKNISKYRACLICMRNYKKSMKIIS